MKAALGVVGLLGLLITVAIMMQLFATNAKTVTEAGKVARTQAEQIAGVGAEGMRAKDSIRLDPMEKNGRITAVLVENIVAGGPMEKYFGLKESDSIIAVGPLDMKDQDGEMAKALIWEAYQRQQELTVVRDGQKLILPRDKNKTAPAAESAVTPAAAPPPPDNTPALQRQLQGIPGVRRGE